MKFLLKKAGLLLALTLLSCFAFAQNQSDSTKRYAKKSFRTLSVGLHGGVLSHYTPFNDKRNGDFRTTQAEWGYGAYIKKQLLPGFGLQADFLAGEVRANALPLYRIIQLHRTPATSAPILTGQLLLMPTSPWPMLASIINIPFFLLI